MFEITLSEDLRARLDALKDIALNQWRENGVSLFSPKAMPRLHFHVQPCPIVNTNTFYTLSTGLILQGRKLSTTDGQNIEYGKGTSCTTAADSPASYEVTCASDTKPFVSISVELDPQVLTDLLATCPEIAAKHKGVVVGHTVHAFTAMPATVDIVEAFERLLRLVYQNPEQLATRGPIIERELTYVLLMSPQGAALSQFFSQNTPANRINRAIQWIRQNTGKPLDIEALAEMCNMTRSTFYRHFQTVTKMTPLQYYKRQCLFLAQHLMVARGYSASQAAYEVGYTSPNQFSREYSAHSVCRPRSRFPNGTDLRTSLTQNIRALPIRSRQGSLFCWKANEIRLSSSATRPQRNRRCDGDAATSRKSRRTLPSENPAMSPPASPGHR